MIQISTQPDRNEQLITAAESGDLPRVQHLLQAGADINDYPLRLAAHNGHTEVVQLLLDNDANLHVGNDGALRLASLNGHVEVVLLLLDNGADIHADDDGALRLASLNGHTAVTTLLFNQEPDYFSKLIEQDNELSANESLRALVNHYRLAPHLQSKAAPRIRRAQGGL